MTSETSILLELDAEMQKVIKLRNSRDEKTKKLRATQRNLLDLMRDIHAECQVGLGSRKAMAKALMTINDICCAELEANNIFVR